MRGSLIISLLLLSGLSGCMLFPLNCVQQEEMGSEKKLIRDRPGGNDSERMRRHKEDRRKWSSSDPAFEVEGVAWIRDDYAMALTEARKLGKPLFVHFTGDMSTNCRWLEKEMFARPEIAELLGRYVALQLYTDRRNDISNRNRQMQIDRFGTIDLPYFTLITPQDSVIGTFRFTRSAEEFRTFLQSGLN